MDKRITWIDTARTIGIFLVVLGHICTNKVAYDVIYSFHMPLFFILSGFLYSLERKEKFYLKNFKNIMIPFFIYGTLCYIYWVLIERHLRIQQINIYKPLINLVVMNGSSEWFVQNAALWFLPCLFLVKIIYHYIQTRINRKKGLLIILTLVSFAISYYIYKIKNIDLFFTLNRVGLYLPFYVVGVHLSKYKDNNQKLFKVLIGSIIIFILCFFTGFVIPRIIINTLLYPVLALSGSFFVIEVSKNLKLNKLNYIGKNTLIILLIHEPVKRLLIKAISVLTKVSDEILRSNVVYSIFITFLVIIVLLPFIWIINKYFAFSLGKGKKKNG